MSLTRPNVLLRTALAALALLMVLTFSTARPVNAETAGQRSTRNIILGAVALAAGIVLYNNYHHKQLAHNTIVGYTADGGTIYADGRVVYPDGTVLYASNNGRTRCSYDGYGVPCDNAARVYRVARNDDQDERPVSYGEDEQQVYSDRENRTASDQNDRRPRYRVDRRELTTGATRAQLEAMRQSAHYADRYRGSAIESHRHFKRTKHQRNLVREY